MNKDLQKLKAILSVAFIYIPVILFVLYFDLLFTAFIFKSVFNTTSYILLYTSLFLWLYIQALVIFFYYRCIIGINKIYLNNKDFFLK